MAPRTLERGYTSMVVPLISMYFAQQLDTENPWILQGTRAAFALVVSGSLYAYILVNRGIQTSDNQTQVTYLPTNAKKKKKSNYITTSVKEYELAVFSKEITQLILSNAVLLAIHVLFGAYTSLFVACCTGPFSLFESPLVKAHILHEDLARPFTEPETMLQSIKSEFKNVAGELQGQPRSAQSAQEAADAFRNMRRAANNKRSS